MDNKITIDSENFTEITELNVDNWVVVGLPNGKAAKISRDNLKAFLGTVQTIVPKAIKPTDPAPVIPGIYRPTVSGPYPNLGGLVVDMNGKMNEVLFDGATIANVVTALPAAEVTQTIQANETTKAVSGKAVADYAMAAFNYNKTYNLLNINERQEGKLVNETTGVISNGSFNITGFTPIKASTQYRYTAKRSNYRVFYYDANKAYISVFNNTSGLFTTPANAAFVVAYLDGGKDYTGAMITEGAAIFDYMPYGTPLNTEFFALKKDVPIKTDLVSNVNPFFGNLLDNNGIYTNANSSGNIVNNDNPFLNTFGIERSYVPPKFATFNVRFGLYIDYGQLKTPPRYVYFSCIVETDRDYALNFVETAISTKMEDNSNKAALSIIWQTKELIAENTYLLKVCAEMQTSFLAKGLTMTFARGFDTLNYSYRFSGLAYFTSNELHANITLLKSYGLYEGYKINNNKYIKEQAQSGFNYIENSIRGKKVVLYGTSVEESGYFNSTASRYDLNFINHGYGGSNIMFTDDPAIANIIYNNQTTNAQRAFSCTQAEKEAYCTARGISLTPEDLAVSYDNSVLGNLDADLFIFGTYGINDRKSGNDSAFVIDTERKFDRTTIYGAYNYVLKKLFEAKPSARVIITGQHAIVGQDATGWVNTEIVNEIQREVAKLWKIPFLDWGYKLGFSTEPITIGGVTKSVSQFTYTTDGAHLTQAGARAMSHFLTRALRDTLY